MVNIESLFKGKNLKDAICGCHCVSAGNEMLIESERAAQRRIRNAVNIDGKVLVVQMQHHDKERLVTALNSYDKAMLFRLLLLHPSGVMSMIHLAQTSPLRPSEVMSMIHLAQTSPTPSSRSHVDDPSCSDFPTPSSRSHVDDASCSDLLRLPLLRPPGVVSMIHHARLRMG